MEEIKKNFYGESHNKPNKLRIAKTCDHECYKFVNICCRCIGTFECITCTIRIGRELRAEEIGHMATVVDYFAQLMWELVLSLNFGRTTEKDVPEKEEKPLSII